LTRDPVAYGFGVPRGDGEPVLLIPGFTAGDLSLNTMSRWLKRIGYKPYLSGIDLNVGCPKRKIELLGWRLEKIARESDRRLTIIGHSLGGVLGRAMGALHPGSVRQVIALGSPIRSGWQGVHDGVRPALEVIQSFWQTFVDNPRECGTAECPCGFFESVFSPTPRGTNFCAIYTRRDEVVQWESCIDDEGCNYEVSGRHLGLIVNPEVYRIVAALLAGEEIEQAAGAAA
jgi:triacylglycerol lipase